MIKLKLYNLFSETEWEKLSSRNWLNLLKDYPEYAVHLNDWSKIKSNHLCRLLLHQPQFKDVCNLEALTEQDWYYLHCNVPELREWIDDVKDRYLIMKELDN